jgi:hypothetical protein
MKNLLYSIMAFAALGCNAPADNAQSEETTNETVENEILTFGEGISLETETSANDFMAKLTAEDSVENVLISGIINSCCQKKGCWMKVDIGEGREMMVRFKDYGFFMPMDCSGATVRLQGRAFKETVSVDDLRHYAEDAGKTPEEIAAITVPEVRYSFEANGVELLNYTPTEAVESKTPGNGENAEEDEEAHHG